MSADVQKRSWRLSKKNAEEEGGPKMVNETSTTMEKVKKIRFVELQEIEEDRKSKRRSFMKRDKGPEKASPSFCLGEVSSHGSHGALPEKLREKGKEGKDAKNDGKKGGKEDESRGGPFSIEKNKKKHHGEGMIRELVEGNMKLSMMLEEERTRYKELLKIASAQVQIPYRLTYSALPPLPVCNVAITSLKAKLPSLEVDAPVISEAIQEELGAMLFSKDILISLMASGTSLEEFASEVKSYDKSSSAPVLHFACGLHDPSYAHLLLLNRFDPNQFHGPFAPLHVAACCATERTLFLLCYFGANPLIPTKFPNLGNTFPLQLVGLKKRKDEEGEEGDEDGGKSGYLKGELGMKGEEAGLDGEGGGVVWSVDEEGRKLALGRMKLHWVPAGVTAYRNIVSLDLSRNSLSFLPSFLGKLLKLKNLDVRHNPLGLFPQHVRNNEDGMGMLKWLLGGVEGGGMTGGGVGRVRCLVVGVGCDSEKVGFFRGLEKEEGDIRTWGKTGGGGGEGGGGIAVRFYDVKGVCFSSGSYLSLLTPTTPVIVLYHPCLPRNRSTLPSTPPSSSSSSIPPFSLLLQTLRSIRLVQSSPSILLLKVRGKKGAGEGEGGEREEKKEGEEEGKELEGMKGVTKVEYDLSRKEVPPEVWRFLEKFYLKNPRLKKVYPVSFTFLAHLFDCVDKDVSLSPALPLDLPPRPPPKFENKVIEKGTLNYLQRIARVNSKDSERCLGYLRSISKIYWDPIQWRSLDICQTFHYFVDEGAICKAASTLYKHLSSKLILNGMISMSEFHGLFPEFDLYTRTYLIDSFQKFRIALHLPKGNRPKSPSQIETLFNPPSPLPPSSPSFSTHSPPSSPFKPPSSPFLPLLSSSSSFPPVSVSFQTKIGRRRGEGGDFVINVKVSSVTIGGSHSLRVNFSTTVQDVLQIAQAKNWAPEILPSDLSLYIENSPKPSQKWELISSLLHSPTSPFYLSSQKAHPFSSGVLFVPFSLPSMPSLSPFDLPSILPSVCRGVGGVGKLVVKEFVFKSIPVGLLGLLLGELLSDEGLETFSLTKEGGFFCSKTTQEIGFVKLGSSQLSLKIAVWTKDKKDLLSKVTYVVECLTKSYYSNNQPAIFCICPSCSEKVPLKMICYCLVNSQPLICCGEVGVEDVAPDFCFQNIEKFRHGEIEKGKLLGEGGFGRVFKGFYTENKIDVAIKEFNFRSSPPTSANSNKPSSPKLPSPSPSPSPSSSSPSLLSSSGAPPTSSHSFSSTSTPPVPFHSSFSHSSPSPSSPPPLSALISAFHASPNPVSYFAPQSPVSSSPPSPSILTSSPLPSPIPPPETLSRYSPQLALSLSSLHSSPSGSLRSPPTLYSSPLPTPLSYTVSTTAEDGGEKEKGGHEPQERDEKTALKEEEKVENEEEAEDTIVILKMVVTDLSGKERSPQKIEKIEQEQRNLSKARGEVDKEQLEKIPEKKYRLFFREVVLMSRLEPHENIVRFYGVQLSPLGIILEYVPGGDLQQLLCTHPLISLLEDATPELKKGTECSLIKEEIIDDQTYIIVETERRHRLLAEEVKYVVDREPKEDKELGWELRLKIALDIAKGMEFLHSQSPPIAHRDLRSPNICLVSLDPNAEVNAKILDFGVATQIAAPIRERLPTWQWCAPEILIPFEAEISRPFYTEACDVYSFGIVLNEISSRKCPFMDDYWDLYCAKDGLQWRSPYSCYEAIVKENLRPLIPSTTPPSFASLTEECWGGDPSSRPTFEKIVKKLELIKEEIF